MILPPRTVADVLAHLALIYSHHFCRKSHLSLRCVVSPVNRLEGQSPVYDHHQFVGVTKKSNLTATHRPAPESDGAGEFLVGERLTGRSRLEQ